MFQKTSLYLICIMLVFFCPCTRKGGETASTVSPVTGDNINLDSGQTENRADNQPADEQLVDEQTEALFGRGGSLREESIAIAGFGYGRNTNKKAAETFAQRFAAAALINQTGGFVFTFDQNTSELTMEAVTTGVIQEDREKKNLETFQDGQYWDACSVYRSSTTLSIPAGFQAESVTTTTIVEDLNRMFLATAKVAIEHLLARYTPDADIFRGRLNLQDLQLEYDTRQGKHTVKTTYFLAY